MTDPVPVPPSVTFNEADPLGRPLGTVTLIPGQAVHGEPLIGGLLVDLPHRRKGIAGRLIMRAEQKARDLGAARVFAYTHPENTEARALFRKLGYTEMIQLEKRLK